MQTHIYNMSDKIDTFISFDISSVGMRSILNDLDPVVQDVKIRFPEKSTHKTWEIPFTVEPQATNFGGHQWFFQCPTCGNRKRILYFSPPDIPNRQIACRDCHGLKYRDNRQRYNLKNMMKSLPLG